MNPGSLRAMRSAATTNASAGPRSWSLRRRLRSARAHRGSAAPPGRRLFLAVLPRARRVARDAAAFFVPGKPFAVALGSLRARPRLREGDAEERCGGGVQRPPGGGPGRHHARRHDARAQKRDVAERRRVVAQTEPGAHPRVARVVHARRGPAEVQSAAHGQRADDLNPARAAERRGRGAGARARRSLVSLVSLVFVVCFDEVGGGGERRAERFRGRAVERPSVALARGSRALDRGVHEPLRELHREVDVVAHDARVLRRRDRRGVLGEVAERPERIVAAGRIVATGRVGRPRVVALERRDRRLAKGGVHDGAPLAAGDRDDAARQRGGRRFWRARRGTISVRRAFRFARRRRRRRRDRAW